MRLTQFFSSHTNKALIFFCIAFILKEPMNLVLWTLSGVFLALRLWEWVDELADEEKKR